MKPPFAQRLKFLFLVLALAFSAACAPKAAPGDANAAPSAAADVPAASSGSETAMPAAGGQSNEFPECASRYPGESPVDISGTYAVSGAEVTSISGPPLTPPYTGELTITHVEFVCFHMVWETDGPDRIGTAFVTADGIAGDWIEGSQSGGLVSDFDGDAIVNFELYENDPSNRLWSETLTRK